MVINLLKQTIRDKKLNFTIRSSKNNIKLLNNLLFNKIITNFFKSKKKTSHLIVFINYCSNFKPVICNISTNFEQNRNNKIQSNFVINTIEKIKKNYKFNLNSKKQMVKFR